MVKDYQPLPKIYCYPAQLNQVWMNLLCNAIDAVLDPGLGDDSYNSRPRITIRTSVLKGDRILVAIHDNGRGIRPELQEKNLRSLLYHETRRNRDRVGPVHLLPNSTNPRWQDSHCVSGVPT